MSSTTAGISLEVVAAAQQRQRENLIKTFYPERGPLRRELYLKNIEFFAAGRTFRERCCVAANRSGKTVGIGGFETVLHLTGEYPEWWPGHRFDHPIRAWAAGDTGNTVRDIIQMKLLGPPGEHGTGLIPKSVIQRVTPRPGVPDAVQSIVVKHKTGRFSTLTLKSFEEKREAFQGTEMDWIWLDEEPPKSIWIESITRTMAAGAFKGGWLCMTYTPVQGWTDVTEELLDNSKNEAAGRYVITLTWSDAPHLSEEEQRQLGSKIPENERSARMRGIPELGSGAVYPFPEEDIVVPDFDVPRHWPRGYGLDVGDKTAAMFMAHNTDTDVMYFTGEYYRSGEDADYSTHAAAIRSRIKAQGFHEAHEMPGWVDPSAKQISQTDRSRLLHLYRQEGLNLFPADNSVAAGVLFMHDRFSTGRLKVFTSCTRFREERIKYRRDSQGRIIKKNDHLCDAGRYCCFSSPARFATPPNAARNLDDLLPGHAIPRGPRAWMA